MFCSRAEYVPRLLWRLKNAGTGDEKHRIDGGAVKAGAPLAESARCSLLGEAQRFAVGQPLGKAPKSLIQADIAVEAADGARSRETFSIRTAARLIFQSSAKQVLTDPVE